MADLPPLFHRVAFQRFFDTSMLPRDAHAGLVFDRYFRCWDRPGQRTSPIEPLLKFIGEFQELGPAHAAELAELHDRLDRLAADGRRLVFRLESRFATGLGNEHPLDNGLTFDRTVGVPYLPGSAVKGLCRAWATLLLGDESSELATIFGEEPREGDDRGCRPGDVTFFPAYPTAWPELAVDIVNNHHPDYYENNRRNRVPRDVESPVPIHFLTVQPGSRFVFRFLSRSGSSSHLERVSEWLCSGLENLGVGAKTSVGFGVLRLE